MREYEKWAARLDFISKEYEFGPIKIIRNEEGRMHCETGPAYVSPTRVAWYRDGKQHGIDVDIFGSIHYFFEGILVPPHYITKKDSLTVEEVLTNPNAEVRYVGIKIIGYDKIKKVAKMKDTNKKKGMELFHIEKIFDEPIAVLKVVNSTPEPDGTFKNYYLMVPPDMKTCDEAVAWTFRKSPKEYKPSFES